VRGPGLGTRSADRPGPDCHAQVVAVNGAHSISVEIGEASLDSAGLTRLIGGRRARYHPGSPEEPGNTMAVDLGAGRLLVVHDVGSGPGLGEQALGQIAADTSVGDIAKACSWPTP
jgi:hypothetical protein